MKYLPRVLLRTLTDQFWSYFSICEYELHCWPWLPRAETDNRK